MQNMIRKRISSIIQNKLGRKLNVLEAVPVIILNDGMGNLTKHEGDGWFVKTNEGVLFVDNYLAIDLEPVRKITDQGSAIHLLLDDQITLEIYPKHEKARSVVLETTTTNEQEDPL